MVAGVAVWSETRTVLRRGIFAKMKIFLPLVVWLVLLFRTASSQYSASRKNVGIFGLKHEVFFLNLEDGYFGCQVNESTDYLQLYELSKLCDGTSDCYMGSDELRNKLKCTNDCDKDGTACSNGACLEGQCHCNDGFGGCNCQVPDENECKYRPCDVFAHCTNTLGSFTCTCFPGYRGDGFQCVDIDECQDPAIAARCVENAECCNLPAHFVCKCKSGFEGDGEERCTDINECLDPQACGVNAECVNVPGNYTCLCRDGFVGDPYNGCVDVDECAQPGVCGPGAICTNLEGGYRCDCPAGFDGDARSAQGCADFDECTRSPCGRNALCRNDVGSFRCECPEGFHGDAMTDCQAACTATEECNQDEVCAKGQCVNPCHDPSGAACGMNAECRMAGHSKQCSCPAGFTGDPALECVRVPVLCSSSAECGPGMACHESMCLPRCGNDQECALNEKCIGNQCMLTCRLDNDCFLGHICLNGRCVYGCHSDDDCGASETCRNNRCTDPCRDNPCGPNAACTVVNHRASCSCINGMVPSPTAKIGCIRAPALQCTENRDCTDGTSCIENVCRPICANDQGCLNNERCDRGTCKPICRRDDDCRTGEVCQGQTCMIGCRSNAGCPAELACVNQQCVNPCQEPTACGTNAICTVANHRKQCVCPAPLVGDPLVGCRAEERSCQSRSDCAKGQACYGNTCMQTCRNDQNCLADERCIRGTCRTVCNSDASCSNGLICENRICQTGCRTDNNCPNNQACINKQCTDPCTVLGQCGSCSECTVVNHGVQCSCPSGYLGNPLVSCSPPPQKCNSYCYCDEEGIYCADKCRQAKDCACGQTCHRGRCRAKCNPGSCPAGQLCQNGACMAGCRSNADCPGERSCTNRKCVDPCAGGKACGKNAICQVADHQALCLCPDGFQGDPREGCVQYECQTNEDCELDKKCVAGKCTNPCLEHDACGLNAQCRVVNRQAQCSCTPGFFGNARQECQPLQKHSCSQNPCGENTICREDANGYECTCQPGCMGDPRQGCLCEGKQTNKCAEFPCGKKAVCRVTAYDQPECYCPPLYPGGDPYVECTNERTVTDCRTTGCAEGECVRDGTQFICRNDESCANDMQCPNEKACIGGKCSDPCSLRGACGDNALCQTVLHRPRCSCPSCYIGRPNVECKPDPKCKEVTTQKPSDPKIVSIACEKDADCDESLRCDASGQCNDPCTIPTTYVCDPNKKCISRRHRPVCVCKHGFIVNDYGELICAPEKRECHGDDGCASNMACIDGKCLNPCMPTATRGPACPEDKACMVMDHKPACVCMKDCSPTLSICLRDSGCPSDLACRNYQCVNPCETTQCADDTPCFVEDHKPICKFCPPGFVKDAHQGCLKELGCRHNDECSVERSCINGVCMDPCQAGNPCEAGQECEVQNHEPVCIKLCQCQKSTDCATGSVCDGCNCIQKDTPSLVTGCEHCPPGIPCNPITGACVKVQCTSNDECPLMEACVGNLCQPPCNVKNPCAQNAVCINRNHGSECSCIEGYHGNGFVSCQPVTTPGSVCQYNEDCPPDKLCDRLNRVCINPCQEDSCGENAECLPRNHGIECRCRAGFAGNAYIECVQLQGCRSDSECSSYEACINGQCASPCQCGPYALCDVQNHKPQCRCPPGYKGDARVGCNPPSNPCDPNPCGLNAMCEIDAGSPVCFCPKGLTGNPFKNCIPEGDDCTPNPCGPNSGCRKINGKASCFCLPEFEGNPPKEPCKLPQNPCDPSPCGPNTQCNILSNGFAKCTCLSGYIESPNTIRGCIEPKNPCEPNPCGFGAVCDSSQNPVCYCPEGSVGNPFRSCNEPVVTTELCRPGPCGRNADCYNVDGREQCYCKPGYVGDAYNGCVEQPRSVCEPNPCGPGAECLVLTDGSPACRCPPGLSGDPTSAEGCHGYECRVDDDCAADKACIGFQCADPCPGSCGTGAHCKVEKHHPVCFCDAGLTGNPAIRCFQLEERVPDNQCNPSPCGVNTQCTVRNRRPVCKCLPNYKGDPKKGCRAECELNSDCPSDKACVNRRCVLPCNGGAVCGVNAECRVEYHTPMCRCPNGFTGDAFVHCVPIPEDRNMTRQPCRSSPCGPQGVCSVYSDDVALCDPCSTPDAIHNPRCRPQCVLNTDCPFNQACIQNRCQDPCPGSCGYNALCTVEQHRPVCSCPPGLYGNPYERCIQQDTPLETCDTIRCGANTDCKRMGGVLACVCKKNYFGDPLVGCRPECVINTDCPVSKACVNNRCQDPCAGVCGVNAICKVVNHLPVCYCPPTHTGDALVACTEKTYLPPDTTPCDPNPCGPNSKCLTTPDNYAVCSCLPGFRGMPPACQAECMINAECPQNKACINLKCVDPCPGTCGVGARCEVLNHNPICSCGPNQQGDPFVICEARQNEPPVEPKNPCDPSPCGLNSICQVKRNRPVCSCQPNFIGSPPYCRPECVLSSECPQDKACINEKCRNPCENACGANAECHVVAHSAFCNCRPGFEGDAFIGCSEVPRHPVVSVDPCYPSPCAENSVCSNVNGAAKCTCIAPYLGDPYNTGCRPECVLNSDCPSHLACVNQHCRDPCPGVCGSNAECTIANHIPVCECSRGYVGDPFRGCRKEVPQPIAPKDPCAQCPSNSVCRIVQGRPTCSCPEGYRGAPPACRPECSSNEECRHDQSCINLKCKDPCPGLCGVNAQCQVINHKPFCSCLKDYYGNPFEQCMPKPAEPVHPCQPSPCGPYSECRELNDRAVCSCVPGMLGTPPNCRPECETHQECPSNRACFGQKCKDPCVGSCGFNALCAARDHRPECYCMDGFEGDPYTGCNPIVVYRDEIIEPCNPSPCGSNAICKERNGAGSCTCMKDYFGDPYVSCRPECVQNSDCPYDRSCVNTKCVDPCIGTCGLNAECHVHNHSPTCTCVTGFVGNPSLACHLLIIEKPKDEPVNPCLPSPCGPYSICRVVNDHAVCSCQSNCIGAPPNCRPECIINSECSRDKSCVNQRCVDPCPGTCGLNARCRTVNHNPICSCNPGFIGDPFVQCSPEPKQPILQEPVNPCQPSPCGPNSICRVQSNRAVCSCIPNYIGRPPSCRPECVVNSECPMNLACVNEKCVDPCRGSCGPNAECRVVSHSPMCTCYPEHTGDPFSGCNRIQIIHEPPAMPCTPSPCGVNAVCREQNGAGSCSCLPEYFGDPYVGCRPECVMNSDCPRTRSCINSKCVDPCPGTCGSNSECHVVNHAPTCTCIAGYIGNPFTACTPQPEIREEPINPCEPSPCGPNSNCRVINNHAVCSCRTNFIGTPPSCRPECVVSSECPLDKACIGQRCKDPCPGTCGLNARCQVTNHNPICSCKQGFTGDPFVRCIPEDRRPVVSDPPRNPCEPSPCGPNSQCKPVGNTAACSCLPNYIGRAPNCRPECTTNSECTSMQACINEKCKNPCPGSCGTFATCIVQNHQPSCKCYDGYTGDPYSACMVIPIQREPEIVDPCNPSPCGVNAECNVRNNAGSCTCLPDYFGDPYHECRPECVLNTDCPKTRSCLNNKCKDPCPGMCGLNAECFVSNHAPTCSCIAGFTGNPSVACHEIPKLAEPIDPCRPSPCGPYSECRVVNQHAVCSCQKNYIGTPPACRPECTVSSECPQDKACMNQRCIDPCPGTCGLNARCNVINHNPICSCSPGFTGDPFIRCLPEEKRPEPKEPQNPCIPNPCGPNSQCRAVGSVPACSCLPNYIGRAPNCRPECTINSECAGNLACINEKCRDPCPGSCGPNAICNVIKHSPVCSCSSGYTGDPFSGCMDIPTPPIRDERQDPCNPSPCGSNAVCKERNGAGSCTCLPEYFGDPYSGCRPECVTNSDCPRNKACVNNKCKDPCPGVCGINAECYVVNHSPSCTCISGFTGDPLSACHEPAPPKQNEPLNPCSPSPCGPNSLCREINGHAVCSCQTGFIGTPPSCRPECVVSSECAQDKACISQKCQDPCPGTCGLNARCQIVNHSPICSCSPGFTGDPFIRCLPEEKRPVVSEPIDPCVPSPCGPNSQCRAVGSTPACSCLPNYIGRAPNCRPECMINAECPANLACVNEKCKDPCVGSCGLNAICTVIKHSPVCECQAGFTGDPFSVCTEYTPPRDPEPVNPCNPSPCGANAVCKERSGAGSCTCLPEYFGDPYTGCRPECVQNSDCDKFRACVNNKCKDPCPGVCGLNAECRVQNHSPICFCLEGYTGDPARGCSIEERVTERPRQEGCTPSPCGPNSQCREVNGHPVCSCLSGYVGTPPSCRPECVVSSECSQDRACLNQKCADPCPGTCGTDARCQVVNHNPICSCSPGFTGDPFIRCIKKEVERDPPEPINPCLPSPCGPNSQCRVVGTQAACTCQANYIGRPPNCRPECTNDAECASNRACQNERCVDPCPGACGNNAICQVINHRAVCTCNDGFEGNPLVQCDRSLPPTTERLTPCTPSPCGPNAECRERNNAGACYCLPNYEGNPYDVFSGCRRECDVNSDCAEKLACVNFKCVDPCPGVCGAQALCDIVNHVPTCVCPEGMIGDPFTRCELRLEEPITRAPPVCDQNTCGPNSICRIQNGVAVCKCQPEMTGSPPNCRPECVQSGDCDSQRACVNYKCIDPCPGSCGQNAKCQVINHNPICSCSPDFTGDPFSRCYKEVRTTTPAPPTPCVPSPCGPNAECKVVGNKEACSCLPDYTGSPPNCRPECVLSTECAQNQACIRQKCTDPCPGSCGLNAKCTVVNHTPSCSCEQGYTGDPFTGCQFIQAKPPPEVDRSPPEDPCYPSPCGTNARCRPVDGGAVCECYENYFGNPYTSCRPECVTNSECSRNTACIQNRCKDPCPGVCGHNAECSVINHTPTCTCREGMVGNAFEQCLREEKPPKPSDPCYPSPCGLNTVCRSSGGNAVCECLPDFKGTPFGRGCYPECTINSDCPRDKTCVNKKCVDPCPGVCGYRAVCHAINNSPVCSCPNNMIGDPFVECKEAPPKDPCNPSPCRTNGICRVVGGRAECQYPECVINSDCSPNRACFNQKCRDPCVGACGVNAICNVVNHAPVCSCPERHVGSPFVQCNRQMDPVPQPECVSDDQCTNDKACINQQCVNPCTASNGLCNLNAECRVQFHRAICTCREGYTGNAQIACYEIGCRSDSDCPATEACVNKNCIDPCRYTQCGRNAVCKTDYNHNARCHCIDGYRGNPLTGCTRPECTRDDECPYHLSCQNEQCRDPCDCAPGAQCRVDNHRASCRCPPGYTGDASFACEKIPVRDPDQCKMDADCSSRLACFSGTCKNPCLEAKPCAQHAICTVQDTLPLRTMYCVCEEGYVGDAEKQCLPVSTVQPGCSSDIECAATETCRNRACVNPCTEFNPCARTAECLAQSHKAICSCPIGMVGDPFQNCYREPVITPECTVDSECPSNRACINQKCQDPCAEGNPCAGNAECRTLTHRPLCMCPQGWGGDPKVQCYKPECQHDNDCPYDKACYNEKCLNPCTYGTTQCGRGAECLAQGHRANCICPAGTQGNPLISCVTGLCQYNEDCADHEACDRLNRVCRPVCDDETCASRATCIGRNHQATCECAPGTRGNPYVECARDEPEPVCRTDGDCPSQQACINSLCANPCTVISPCSRQQSCTVVDTLPLRTMICACPSDMLVDENGQCKPIVVEGCRTDNDCPDTDRCIRGQCMLACRAEPCGVNAQCVSSGHRAKCSCASEYVGNPHIECIPEGRVPSPKECFVDDDCPLDRSCFNERCINPCTQDVCGRGAICHVQLHNAVCNCPAGYQKDANNNCVPPVADLPKCRANSDCATSESCVNEICANPCNCGQNSDCYVKDHYPVCSCKPGYSGNAQFGCFKLGCQSDSECANDKQCYNGECLNPCALENPCALNAECYGDKHRAACRCLPGLEGNPFVQCRRVECHFDGECPDNRACVQEQCIDPCSEMAPCAQNAICFTRGHAPHCKCPDHLPDGNPFSYCERRVVQHKPECTMDTECPSRLACINNKCVDPCKELEPCARSAKCTVLDSVPVRTMVCECPELHVPDVNGECKRIVLQTPPECSSDSECSDKEACINRQCRNPCNCGDHTTCVVKNHRGICSCEDGYEGNPNIACRTIGCRVDSECESGKACINGHCVNPCLDNNPCGINAECYAVSSHAECRCLSGYRGNPLVQCTVVECRSNNDCPNDKQCRNTQCVDPCIYDSSCSPRAECKAQNHLAVCRCPTGLVGNPYVDCRPEVIPECVYDTDCPSHLACIENKCIEPCGALEPCNRPARCEAIPSSPVRTMICVCPDGYVSSGSGTCKPVVKSGCISDSDCSSDTACINSICRNPCNCGPNAECRIKDHKPVCSCKQGFDGNPEIECIKIECRVDDDCSSQHSCINRQCVPVCSLDSCGRQAECYAQNHRAICECLPGYEGDPRVSCKLLGCRADSDCPLDKACINKKCENPCENQAICAQNELCQVYQHRPECACPPPFEADPIRGCVLRDERCRTDGECPSQTACIQGECVNPCNVTEPCGVNSMCKVLDTLPVRTMICECLPGYQGNAAVQCDKMALCPTDRGFIRNANGECACPPGYGLTIYEDCQICREEDGLKIDETGRCVCALERGMVIDERGRCICPVDYGYRLTERGECIRLSVPECTRDSDCPDWRHCHEETRTCEDPCKTKICGKNALCNATNHQAICQCIAGYTGNPEEHCNQTTNFRTDFPQPEMQVTCQADGVQVVIDLMESNFNGVLYVKGHSKDEECRRVVNLAGDASQRTQIFKVHFGSCGLIHVNGIASFVLVIQKHPKLVTYKAQAYHIKCVYQTGEQNVTLGFNVQMLTTAGTIANTGPPPTCAMRIVAFNGEEINSAEIGDNLRLQVQVQPATIYGGFARSCVAKTMEDSVENEYIVTDENGCATEPSIFGDWEYNAETNSLLASFNAFKFPSSDNIRFQCNIRVCFGRCQPVNCHGANAFGKRRRRAITDVNEIEMLLNRTRRAGSSSSTALAGGNDDTLGIEGTLREEITIQSNAILTFDRREDRSYDSDNITPAAQRVEDICVSMIGLIIALVITALLALVAVAVAVSCWLMAYRRRPTVTGPLPHPPEFPNPLFAHHEPSEPSHHDYMT